MTGFLIVIHTIVSLLLIGVVLMQASQGGGLSGTFGGNAASSVLGGQNAGNVLSRITTWLATLFLTLAVIISVLSGPTDTESTSLVKQAAENRPGLPATDIIPTEQYLLGIQSFSYENFEYIRYALIKAVFFAFIITSVSSYFGYYTSGGALEVGKQSTKAVVYSSILILMFNVLLTQLLLS